MSEPMGAELDRLTRWVDAGGTWQLLGHRPDRVVLALCRCDGGEEVDRMVAVDPVTIAWVADQVAGESAGEALAD